MRSLITRLALATAIATPALPASAHFPFFMPGPAPSIDQAVVLPSAQTTWHIFGVLSIPGQTDFIRLNDLDSSQSSSVEVDVFNKPAYLNFAPSIALIGQGLPQPTEKLPFALPAGYGALVGNFAGDPTQRQLFADDVYIWFIGPSIDVPALTGLPAYIAVWDPKGGIGEYTASLNIDPDVSDPSFEGKFTAPIYGDGNDDGKVDVVDASIALRITVGLAAPTPRQLYALDVYPPSQGKQMAGDGKITVTDVLRILKRSVGEEPDPFP